MPGIQFFRQKFIHLMMGILNERKFNPVEEISLLLYEL
jgi:hypothetical protein